MAGSGPTFWTVVACIFALASMATGYLLITDQAGPYSPVGLACYGSAAGAFVCYGIGQIIRAVSGSGREDG